MTSRSRHSENLTHTLAWIRCVVHVRQQDRPCAGCRGEARADVSRFGETLIERTADVVMELDGHPGMTPTPLTYAYAVDLLTRLTPLIRRRGAAA